MGKIIIKNDNWRWMFSTLYVTIGNTQVSIKPKETKEILLEDGNYPIHICDKVWYEKRSNISLLKDKELIIKGKLPTTYNVAAISLMLLFLTLVEIGLIPSLLFSTVFLILLAPLIYFALFKKNNFYKILEKT